MKKTIILILALAALLFVWILYKETAGFFNSKAPAKAVSTEANWIPYNSPSGLFTILMPSTPEYKTEIERDTSGFAIRTNETYISEDSNKNLYTIYFIRYLADGQLPLPPNTLLNNLMYEILDSQPGSQLLGFRKITFKGMNALEFTLESGELMMDAIAFVKDNDLYLLSVMGKNNSYHSKDFSRFTQSFQFKD